MKVRKKLLLAITLLVTILMAGCTTPASEQISVIPADARKIATLDLTGRTGTFTEGDIIAWNDGYVVLDIKLNSGTMNTLEIVDTTKNEVVDTLKKLRTGIYDSKIYGYRSDREYKLNFVNTKNLSGSIDIYFVSVY